MTAAAALALGATGGCMGHHAKPQAATLNEAPPVASDPAPLTPEQQTALKVKNYTADINAALDNQDADKFREVNKPPAAPNPPKPVAQPTTRPTLATAVTPNTTPPAPSTQPAAAATSQPATVSTATVAPMIPAAPPALADQSPSCTTLLPTTSARANIQPALIRTEPTFNEAMAVLRKRVAAHPTLNTTLALSLLDTSEGREPNPALAASLSASDQQLLKDLLGALQGMTPISSLAPLPDRAAPLVDAARRWQGDQDLTLPKMALASRVDSFGVYTPVEPKFPQGAARTVILYCEVANFTSRKDTDGFFETKLQQQESLITSDGLLVYRPSPEEVEDRSLNQRHDFYLVKKVTIPATLAVGRYTLRMSVKDVLSDRICEVTMPVEIVPGDDN